jgi:hypothetical protein
MFIEFTEKDILRSKIVEPAFYRVRIEDIESKISNKGDSTNFRLEGVILKNADNGNEKYAGVPTPYLWFFNSKQLQHLIPVIQAVDPAWEVKPGVRVDPELLKGQELEVYIGNGTYNNQIQNQITNQYRPVVEKRVVR